MGIKEYLTGKKQKEVKYRLSDIVWVHNMYKNTIDQSAINVPFIPNRDETKYKNLLTNEIVELPLVFKGTNPVATTLCKSVGLDYSNGGCGIMESWHMIDKSLNVKGVSSKILRDYKAYEAIGVFKDETRRLEDFCKDTAVTQCQLVDFANSLTKARNIQNAKENALRLKRAKEDAEYERNVRDF